LLDFARKNPRALWVTGACVNVDELAALTLSAYGYTVYTVVPYDQDHIDKKYRKHCSVYELMLHTALSKSQRYMDRNQRMVQIAIGGTKVYCFAFPDEPETTRSGTWATVRRCRKAGIPKSNIFVKVI
jgi:hypothetical protein